MSRNANARQGQLWGYLAASVLFASLATIAFHHGNARAEYPPACADLSTVAECGFRLAEVR